MNTLAATAATEQHDGYTMTAYAPITIGKTVFKVDVQEFPEYDSITWLTGPRGAAYILKPYRPAQGLYIAQSFTSGHPMRRGGNTVLIRCIGDLIEQA